MLCIGSRKSPLAVWQVEHVASLLKEYSSEAICLKYLETKADANTATPIHKMKAVGVFTSQLNQMVLNKTIDIAVHSLKDLPTVLENGITLEAVVGEREEKDVLVTKNDTSFKTFGDFSKTIATGSLRRKAQWLKVYAHHTVVDLRGNIATRLEKLDSNNIDGIIMAEAAIKRLQISGYNIHELDTVPSPGQGLLGICCRENDEKSRELCRQINNNRNFQFSSIERGFMQALEGGCSMPIGAFCFSDNKKNIFTGQILSLDGKKEVTVSFEFKKKFDFQEITSKAIRYAKEFGAEELISLVKKQMQ